MKPSFVRIPVAGAAKGDSTVFEVLPPGGGFVRICGFQSFCGSNRLYLRSALIAGIDHMNGHGLEVPMRSFSMGCRCAPWGIMSKFQPLLLTIKTRGNSEKRVSAVVLGHWSWTLEELS